MARHGAMRTSGLCCWALLCFAWGLAAPRPPRYCERADVAWRAYRAPAAFEARVQSTGESFATVQVRRVLRKQGNWPRRDQVLRLRLPALEEAACRGRFEIPLRNQRNYIVFAERRGHSAMALGPPLKRTRKLLRRIRAVYAKGYSECHQCCVVVVVISSPHGTWRLEPATRRARANRPLAREPT